MQLDHVILMVNDRDKSADFYTRGASKSVYLFDPNKHLVEITCYSRRVFLSQRATA
jgi:hypothetical protein